VDGSTIEKILLFEPKPLNPEIKVRMDIVSRNKVKCIRPLTHLYAANSETFRLFQAENMPEVPGHAYIGSITI
jgi:hypothetical protein